jgi:hypothetical protein
VLIPRCSICQWHLAHWLAGKLLGLVGVAAIKRLVALGGKRSVVNALGTTCALQAAIGMVGPCRAPRFQLLGPIPLPRLLAEPVGGHFAHGQHDMRVGLIAPV